MWSNNNAQDDASTDSRFSQTLRNVQGLLKGRIVPGKVLLTRRPEPADDRGIRNLSPSCGRSFSDNGAVTNERLDMATETASESTSGLDASKMKHHKSNVESLSREAQRPNLETRLTDSTRVTRFDKVLASPTIILDRLRELSWSGVPPFMRPNTWRLLLGYAPSNSSRRDEVLRRKRSDYLDLVAQFYDLPDIERSNDEIGMLRQISLDCPRTVPDVGFFQQPEVQKSLERILYIWAIRHPASGYVQGINDLVTPFLVVFSSEYIEGKLENWSICNLSQHDILNIEADCYWCLCKVLDCMQDHYTFAQPGIQRLVFKLKELVRRIDESLSRHIEEQGLEYLQFAFRWFNCLLIRELPFHLVTRLWDTYLAEGDSLPDFLVYIAASFLLTWSKELLKLDFQEMVMFLQHLPTRDWSHQQLEMVLSRAFMWHSMFNRSPSHLAG